MRITSIDKPNGTESRLKLPFTYRCYRKFLKLLIRPTIVGQLELQDRLSIYALQHRSLTDIATLQIACEKANLSDPFESPPGVAEDRSFFCLRRSAGFKRRLVMFRFSERFRRIHQAHMTDESLRLHLVPVSIFWGRVNRKSNSFLQAIFSEQSSISLGFRRLLCLVFSRSDIVIHFGPCLDWQNLINRKHTHVQNLRHVGRELRHHLVENQHRVIGPINPPPRETERLVVSRSSTTQTPQSKDEQNKSRKLAKTYYKNIRTKFSYPVIKFFSLLLRPYWKRCFSGIEVHGIEQLAEHSAERTVVYVPNHRSHLDYILLSYVLFTRGFVIPHVASGDNLNLPVVGGILRRLGAFYIKRSYHDLKVYRNVLESYLYEIIRLGNPVEFFVEGTRSRTGWMLPPQYGLIRTLLECHEKGLERPISIVPVYANYERLLEMNGHISELKGAKKQSENVFGLVRNLLKLSSRMGTLSISFGDPLNVAEYSDSNQDIRSTTERFAFDVIHSINGLATVNAMNLVCMAISCGEDRNIRVSDLLDRIEFTQTLLRLDSLNHSHLFARDPAMVLLKNVLEMYETKIEGEKVEIPTSLRESAFWYRNNSLHTLFVPALCIYVVKSSNSLSKSQLHQRVSELVGLFANLLVFRNDENASARWIQHLENAQIFIAYRNQMTLNDEAKIQDRAKLLATWVEPWFLVSKVILTDKHATSDDKSASHKPEEALLSKTQTIFESRNLELPIEFNTNSLKTISSQIDQYLVEQAAIQNREQSKIQSAMIERLVEKPLGQVSD